MLFMNLSVCVCLGVLAFFLVKDGLLSSGKMKFKVGVVGDMTDPYLGFGIDTLQAIDETRFMMELESMPEQEARAALQKGELDAIAIIPKGMIESIENGYNDLRIAYVSPAGQMGLGSIVAHEIMDTVSNLVTRSQSGIYGMQEILLQHGRNDIFWEATERLNFRYFDLVLSRKRLYELETLGISGGLSTEGYYFGSILVVFLLLSGINASALLSREDDGLPRLWAARGMGAVCQVAGEYAAYAVLMSACMAAVLLIPAAVFENGAFELAEWEGLGAEPLVQFWINLIPSVLMIAAMQFLICELAKGVVGGILLQFICSISMAYLSGCFYPTDFFPQALQTIGNFLPSGVAMRCAGGSIIGDIALSARLAVLLYLGAFLGLSAYVRKIRILRG